MWVNLIFYSNWICFIVFVGLFQNRNWTIPFQNFIIIDLVSKILYCKIKTETDELYVMVRSFIEHNSDKSCSVPLVTVTREPSGRAGPSCAESMLTWHESSFWRTRPLPTRLGTPQRLVWPVLQNTSIKELCRLATKYGNK